MSPRLFLPLLAGLTLFAPRPVLLCAEEPNEKAARLLDPLAKRPGSGPLFERFVNAWLDTGTLESLGKFLGQRVAGDPSTANRLLLALFHARQGEPLKALEQFRAALVLDPGSAEIWYQKALLESRTLDFDAAIASLEKCLAARPAAELSLKASQLSGRLLARAGRSEDALKTWRALVAQRPDDADLREDILELQMAESLWPAAQETATQLVEMTRDPYRRVLRRMRLGDVLDRSGQRDKALETFAACLDDTGAGSWLEKEIVSQMEKLFRREDDLSGLRTFFTKLLPQHAQRAGLQRAQARLLMELGETEAAIACGRALMALSPGDRAVREEFIALLTSAGRATDAIPQVQQLLQQSPDDLELHLTLADLKHAAKDDVGALAELRAYEQKAAAQEGAALRLAGIMDRYGMVDEAVKTLRAALDRGPGQPEARLMLASLLHKAGRKEEALAEWQSAAASGTIAVVQQAARAMQAHGETGGAWRIMQSAVPKAENDPVFLTQLCAFADSPERARAAVPAARRLVELAHSASDLGNFLDVAQRVVRMAGEADALAASLAQSATSPQSLCLLATLLESARDTIGANAALEKARALAPELALAQLVRLWSMRGDFAQAAAVAENLFNSPGGRQAHVAELLASLHQRAGDIDAALRWTQEWKKLVPGATAPVIHESKLLESVGRDAESLTALRVAAGRFESNEEIRSRLAALSLQTGRSADALRLYSTLYEEAADLASKMRWLQPWGQAALRAGRLEELIAQFEDRHHDSRESPQPLMALAELHRIADNYDGRRKALTEAARLKPDDPEIALEIAKLESREEHDEAAIQTLRAVLPKDKTGKISALMADLLIRTGKEDEGLKLLADSAGATAASAETTALAFARRGDETTALAFLQPHLATWPGDWRLGFIAALLEWRTAQPEKAAERLLALTGVTEPLSRLSSTTSVGKSAGHEELVLQTMPPDVQRFFRLILASGMAAPAGNQQQWIQQSNYNYSSAQSIYSLVPSDMDELHDRSAAVLLDIGKSAAPEKMAEWAGELEHRGFAGARILAEVPSLRRFRLGGRSIDLSEWLNKFPGNRPLLAFVALNAAYNDRTNADAALAERAWAAFHLDAPAMALFLALPGAGRSEMLAAWEEEVVVAVEKLEKAPPLLLLAALRSAGLHSGEEDSDERKPVPDIWRKRIVGALSRWREAQNSDGDAQGYAGNLHDLVFNGLSREYGITKNHAALAALLDAEWRWAATQSQSLAKPSLEEALVQPAGFPPWFLPCLPDTLREFIQKSLTPETATAIVPLLQEPVVQVLLMGRIPGGGTGKVLAKMRAAQPASAVPFILSAAWAEKNGDFAAAAELATRALYLPVTPEVRRRVDGALAYWASRKGKPNDALYAAGREAALRLRRDAVTAERRVELAGIMDTLGLTAEADRLMRQGKASAAVTGGAPLERAERLLKEGKKKEAVPLLLSEFRGWARQRITTDANSPGNNDLPKWRTLAQVHGLLRDIMQAMQPPEATPIQMAEYAAACEMTGEPERAREAYERSLAAGVRKKVPQRLLRLVLRNDPARAIALLREMPGEFNNAGIRRWSPVLLGDRDDGATLEQLLRFGRFMEQFLTVLPPDLPEDFPASWILDVVGSEANAGAFYSAGQIDAGGELNKRQEMPIPAEATARAEEQARERMALFERLCRSLMMRPGCGLVAWRHLRDAWTAQKKDPAQLIDAGMAVVCRELSAPRSKKQRSEPDGDSELRNVLGSLMRDVVKAGRVADFTRMVVPVMRSTLSQTASAKLLEDWPLYEAAPEQFVVTARAQLQTRGPQAWSDIIQAANLRKLGAALSPDLLAHLAAPDAKDAADATYLLGTWCEMLQATEGRDAVEKFFSDAVTALMGPAAQRAAVLKDEKQKEKVERLGLLLNSMSAVDGWTGRVLHFICDEILPNGAGDRIMGAFPDYTCSRFLAEYLQRHDYVKAREFLDSLPMTDDLPGFFGGEMLMDVAKVLRDLTTPAEQELLGFGGAREQLSFGRQLLLAQANGGFAMVCNQMARFQSFIEVLPGPQRGQVLSQLLGFTSMQLDDLTAEGRAFHTWLMKDSSAAEQKNMDESIAGFLKDADNGAINDAGELGDQLGRLLAGMAWSRPARAREVIVRACRIAEALGTDEARQQVTDELINEAGNGRPVNGPAHTTDPEELAWLCGLLAEALRQGMPAQNIDDGQLSGWGSGLYYDFRAADFSIAGQLERFVGMLGPQLQAGDARLLVLWLLNAPGSSGPLVREYADGIRWAQGPGRASPHNELVHEMEMAMRFHMARHEGISARCITDEASLPAEQQHYLAVIRDPALPLSLRLSIACSLTNIGDKMIEPPLAHEAARLLIRSLADRQRVPARQEALICSALARLPVATRDASLIRSLLSLTTLPFLRGQADDFDTTAGLSSLTELALQGGDTTALDRLLELEGSFPGVETLAVLARQGETRRIADLLKRNPDALLKCDGMTGCFDAALQSQLPAALGGIADPDVRFELLARLTLLPDCVPPVAGISPRSFRALDIAEQFIAVPWKNLAVRDRMLELIVTSEPSTAPALLRALHEVAGRVPLTAVPLLDEEGITRYGALHASVLHHAATTGNLAPVSVALSQLHKRPWVDPDNTESVRVEILNRAADGLLQGWTEFGEESRGKVCADWRQYMADPDSRQWPQEWAWGLQFGLVLHGLAGRMEDLLTWWSALPETDQALMRLSLQDTAPGTILANYREVIKRMPGTADDRAARSAAIFTALAANPMQTHAGPALQDDFIDNELGTAADFLKLEEPLTRARPEDSWMALAFAKTHAVTGAWDAALTRANAALAKEKPARDTAYAPLLELRTLALENANRGAEVLAEIRTLTTLPPGNSTEEVRRVSRGALVRLLKRLDR